MINLNITDPGDAKIKAKVDKSNALCIIENPFPPFNITGGMRVFRQFLTDDGTSSGSNDMKVDGSSTNVDFWIPASPDKDRYITNLAFTISDLNASLNSFGTLSALTNGCVLEYEDQNGTVTIHDELKTNYDFVQMCLGNPAFGDGTAAFRASNVSGNSEGYLPVLDMRQVFGFRWGVKLAVGTNQRFTLRVRDNTSNVDRFDCVAYGFERSE